MQYLRSAAVILILLTSVLFFSSCGGSGSSSVGPITSITLAPSPNISLNGGDSLQFTVSATDARGRLVQNQPFTFNTNPTGVIQIANGGSLPGLICAGGQWLNGSGTADLTNPVVCAPPTKGSPFNVGQTTVTVTAQGVTSNAVTVSVHPKVARVVLSASNASCVSQGGKIVYTLNAFDANGIDITSQVGNFTWTIGDSTVGTLSSTTSTVSANTVTAALPGVTTVTATVNATNPVNSNAVAFQECPVASITITGANSSITTVFSPSPTGIGTTQQMSATVFDTNGNAVNNPIPTLTWNSSSLATASISTAGLVTAVAFGNSSITASCALNSTCNKGQGSLITSNTAIASVGPGASGTTVYATGTGTTSLVPIPNTTNTPGTAITLPATPNSLVFDPQGSNAYLGSASGLMIVNATNNTFNKTISNAPGKVLAVSPNGQTVLVGGVGYTTVLYNASASTVTTLGAISNATAGDFSPDGTEAVVVNLNTPATPSTSTSTVFVVQGATVRTVTTLAAPGATDVSFLPNGALAYVANSTTPSVEICNSTMGPGLSTTSKLKGIFDPTNPNQPKMLGTNSPSLTVIVPTLNSSCPPLASETRTNVGLGGAFTANQIIVTPDSNHAYVPAGDVPGKLLSYNVAANTAGSVTLTSGTAVTTTGGATLDSNSVYVGVSDSGGTVGSVHQIDVASGNDIAQISVGFIPDLVAVRPH